MEKKTPGRRGAVESGEFQDQKNIARDVSNVEHWGNGSYEIKLTDLEAIDCISSLLKQSLRKNKINGGLH